MLSRQAVKFGHVALFEGFYEPGWATTSRGDLYGKEMRKKKKREEKEECISQK